MIRLFKNINEIKFEDAGRGSTFVSKWEVEP